MEDRDAPIIEAVRDGDLDKVLQLLEDGADPNEIDILGETALFEAAAAGNVEMAAVLLLAGADPCKQSTTGSTAQDMAEIPDIRSLLKSWKSDSDVSEGSAHMAAYKMLPLSLCRKVDVCMKGRCSREAGQPEAATDEASFESGDIANDAGVEKILQELKEDPIFVAVQEECLPTVRSLLEQRASPDSADLLGETPLFEACASGNVVIAAELLLAGADPCHVSPGGSRAIDLAAEMPMRELLQFAMGLRSASHQKEYSRVLGALESGMQGPVLSYLKSRSNEVNIDASATAAQTQAQLPAAAEKPGTAGPSRIPEARQRQMELEAKRKAAEEASAKQQMELEAKRQEAHAKQQMELEAKRQAAQQRLIELEKKQQGELNAKSKAAEDARQQQEEQEARRQAAEEARLQMELEVKRVKKKSAEDAKQQTELDAKRKAAEEAVTRQIALEAKRRAAREAKEQEELEVKKNAAEEAVARQMEWEAKKTAAQEAKEQRELDAKTGANQEAPEERRRQTALDARRKTAEEAAQQRQMELDAKRKAAEEAVRAQAMTEKDPARSDAKASMRQPSHLTAVKTRIKELVPSDDESDEEIAMLYGKGNHQPESQVEEPVEIIAKKVIGDMQFTIACKNNTTFREVKSMIAERIGRLDQLDKIWLVHKSNSGVYEPHKESDVVGQRQEVLFLSTGE